MGCPGLAPKADAKCQASVNIVLLPLQSAPRFNGLLHKEFRFCCWYGVEGGEKMNDRSGAFLAYVDPWKPCATLLSDILMNVLCQRAGLCHLLSKEQPGLQQHMTPPPQASGSLQSSHQKHWLNGQCIFPKWQPKAFLSLDQ